MNEHRRTQQALINTIYNNLAASEKAQVELEKEVACLIREFEILSSAQEEGVLKIDRDLLRAFLKYRIVLFLVEIHLLLADPLTVKGEET